MVLDADDVILVDDFDDFHAFLHGIGFAGDFDSGAILADFALLEGFKLVAQGIE